MTHSKKPPKRPLRRLHVALEELEDRGLGLAHAHAALAAAARGGLFVAYTTDMKQSPQSHHTCDGCTWRWRNASTSDSASPMLTPPYSA